MLSLAGNPGLLRPWNLMIKHRYVQRRGRRSHTTVSYTDPLVSMDLLRAVLQPSFNNDIMAVFRKYQKVRGHIEGGQLPALNRCEHVCMCCSSLRRQQRT
uniref:Deoxynucleotidyltransferase terminal-interacting protein 1 n=1 Tax=Nothobranchius furzeri TaxID=105023 RepID=A0A8C6NP83_NOTFU